jgi:hypothetical protein
MKGTIYKINKPRGMVAVRTEDGDFSIFELLGADPIETGDQVSWRPDTSSGSTPLNNITQGEAYLVCFQNHMVPEIQLRQQLLGED